MKAIVMTKVGPPEVLELRERPEPSLTSPTQIKVRVRAAGVNPIDTKLRRRGLLFPEGLPAILGCDGAGVVVEVGAAVSNLSPGDEVWYCHGGLGADPGNYAEYHLVEAALARRKPRSLDFQHAAAGPLVLLTAWEALYDRARLQEGQHVLIHAGAGGVGHVAIQLAVLAGARVCTTVGSAEKAALVRDLGAELVINYREQDWVEAVDHWTGGEGVDIGFDTLGGELFRQTIPLVAHYGDLVTILEPTADIDWKEARTRNLRIGFELMLTPMLRALPKARAHQGEILDRCADLIDAGRLRIHVSEAFPLAQAAAAHSQIEAGHVQGKLVLLP